MSQIVEAARAALKLLRTTSHSVAETVRWEREAHRVEALRAAALETEGQRRDYRQEQPELA